MPSNPHGSSRVEEALNMLASLSAALLTVHWGCPDFGIHKQVNSTSSPSLSNQLPHTTPAVSLNTSFAVCCSAVCIDVQPCCRSRVFPNDEMDQFATTVRQVARTLWTVHVTLQMGFEEEVLPGLSLLLPCLAVHLAGFVHVA